MTERRAAYRTKRSPLKRSEHDEQAAVIAWARMREAIYPELKLLFAVPNGARTSYSQAKKLKAEGMRRGVPDLIMLVARQQWHGLAVEMKTTNGTVSEDQRKMLDALTEQGYLAVVCYSAGDAIETLVDYLGLPESGTPEWY